MKTKKNLLALPAAVLLAFALHGPAAAQEDPGHPRVNEVQGRIDRQQERIDQGVRQGQITPGQAGRDERRDARVERQLHRDEAAHGGHITKREQARLNRELNRNSNAIHRQRHQ